jgi:hypothetical protein
MDKKKSSKAPSEYIEVPLFQVEDGQEQEKEGIDKPIKLIRLKEQGRTPLIGGRA